MENSTLKNTLSLTKEEQDRLYKRLHQRVFRKNHYEQEKKRGIENSAKYRSNPNNAIKLKARKAVFCAVRNKSLSRKPCEICGDVKAEAHHDDYTKPLDIRWFCVLHHREHERKLTHDTLCSV